MWLRRSSKPEWGGGAPCASWRTCTFVRPSLTTENDYRDDWLKWKTLPVPCFVHINSGDRRRKTNTLKWRDQCGCHPINIIICVSPDTHYYLYIIFNKAKAYSSDEWTRDDYVWLCVNWINWRLAFKFGKAKRIDHESWFPLAVVVDAAHATVAHRSVRNTCGRWDAYDFWRTAMTFADHMNITNKYCSSCRYSAGWLLESFGRGYNVPKTLTHFRVFRK